MYFKLFKPQDWRKRSAEARRRNCAVLPKQKAPPYRAGRGKRRLTGWIFAYKLICPILEGRICRKSTIRSWFLLRDSFAVK